MHCVGCQNNNAQFFSAYTDTVQSVLPFIDRKYSVGYTISLHMGEIWWVYTKFSLCKPYRVSIVDIYRFNSWAISIIVLSEISVTTIVLYSVMCQ